VSISSEQIRAARMFLRWEQGDLARASGVSLATVKRLERKPGPLFGQARTVEALRDALEAAGVEFTNGGQPGVSLKRKGGVGTRFAAGEFGRFSGTGLMGVGTRFAAGEFGRVVEQLRELTDRSNVEVLSKEEFLESVEAISPALAEKIAPYLKRKGSFL
jgi:transcriptional regulator with XRE-family HTH domain